MGDEPLDAAVDLPVAFAFSAPANDVSFGSRVSAHSGIGDDVDGLVQWSVSAPV
jgi:hypothetical protein